MSESRADLAAVRLTERVDGLGRALTAAGADPAAAQRLLELAAVAAMHAVGLRELASLRTEAPPRRERQPEPVASRLSAAA